MSSRTMAGSLGLNGDWLLGEDNWKDGMDDNLLWLSVLTQGRFTDVVAAEPGVPTEGMVYILAASHGTHPNEIAVYDEGAWHYRAALVGWRLFNTTLGLFQQWNGTTWALDSTSLTAEDVRDIIGAALTSGTNVTITPNDGADTITIDATGGGSTDEQIQDMIATFLQQGSNVTLTYNDAGNQLTIASSGGGGTTPSLTLDDGAMLILAVDQGTGAQGFGVNPTASGNLNRVPALTNLYTQQKRIAVGVNLGAANSFGQLRGNTAILTGQVGWKFKARFGVGNWLVNGRIVVGAQAGWAGNTDPSAAANIFVVGNDSADTNLQIIHNDGSGTAAKIDLGANFPANTASVDFYDVELTMAPGGASCDYKVTRVNTGHVATGTVVTELPATTTLLYWGSWFGTGATNGTFLGDVMWEWAKTGT